uniref:Uncharacterized protein n=1 Tax=Anguilla anguilla TaxID=7936 RepID=A0A0E9VXW2_ANGAN
MQSKTYSRGVESKLRTDGRGCRPLLCPGTETPTQFD